MPLLNITHQPQRSSADCLVACAAMGLGFLGKGANYKQLTKLLGTTAHGTPFFHIDRLTSEGVDVKSGRYGDLSLIEEYINSGLPVIAGVTTFAWQHWNERVVEHAVIVAGMDEENIFIHDPAFADAPISMTRLEFEIGWYEKDLVYAIISLSS